MVKDNAYKCNTGRVDGSDAGGSAGEGEGEGGYEGEGGGGQPAVAQDAGEVEGGGRLIAEYSRKQNHMKCSFTLFLQELKMALGGRVKHLEVELAKSERAREELRGKKEAEMVQVRYEKCSKRENHNFI